MHCCALRCCCLDDGRYCTLSGVHPSDDVSSVRGHDDTLSPFTNRFEHARQSSAGAHLYAETCVFCVTDYFYQSGADLEADLEALWQDIGGEGGSDVV